MVWSSIGFEDPALNFLFCYLMENMSAHTMCLLVGEFYAYEIMNSEFIQGRCFPAFVIIMYVKMRKTSGTYGESLTWLYQDSKHQFQPIKIFGE